MSDKPKGKKIRMLGNSGWTVENTLRRALEHADDLESVVVVATGKPGGEEDRSLHIFASDMSWETECYMAHSLFFDTGLKLFKMFNDED